VNNGCDSLTLTFQSIKRVTDVPKCISEANSDDSKLWVLTQIKPSGDTIIVVGPNATLPIAPGETLNFRVSFNPAIPTVVNSNCPDGKLTADDVLPDEVSSQLLIRSSGGPSTPTTTTAMTLTGLVTKEVHLIDPSNPANSPLVKLCRSGNEFIVEFSVYDSNKNVTHATYQFMDSVGRIVGQVFDITLSEAIAGRNLATGQSFTVVQRFTGASDNSQIVSVQVKVFDGDNTTDGATANQVTAGCNSAQSAPLVLRR
jgi:hypothetical protein